MPKFDSETTTGVLLWDIDGTLIRIKRLNSSSPHKNVLRKLGFSLNELNVGLSGRTDYEIMLDLTKDNGGKHDENLLKGAFKDLDEESQRLDGESTFDLYPGVQAILKSLTFKGWTHGILTGNTHVRITTKLEKAGISDHFNQDLLFGCTFGDSRKNIANRARSFLSHKDCSNVVVLGDTPNDIAAARSSNFRVISVATGKFTVAELSNHEPDLLLDDLAIDAGMLFKFLEHLIQ